MSTTYENAPTKSVEVNGTNFVFREIGKEGGIPLVLLHHLTAILNRAASAQTSVKTKNVVFLHGLFADGFIGPASETPSQSWKSRPLPRQAGFGLDFLRSMRRCAESCIAAL
jgi:hypothetical protein